MSEAQTELDNARAALKSQDWATIAGRTIAAKINTETDLWALQKRINRVLALADEWERFAYTGTRAANVLGEQVVTVNFAVDEIRRAARG